MPTLKKLSGKDIVKILNDFGFEVVSQRGSHIKLKRIIDGRKQILTIPDHKELDTGTTKAIFRQTSNYVDTETLRSYFYTA